MTEQDEKVPPKQNDVIQDCKNSEMQKTHSNLYDTFFRPKMHQLLSSYDTWC